MSFDGASFGDGNVSFLWASFGDGDVSFAPERLTSTTLSFQDSVVAGSLTVSARFPKSVRFERLSVAARRAFPKGAFDEVPNFRDASSTGHQKWR